MLGTDPMLVHACACRRRYTKGSGDKSQILSMWSSMRIVSGTMNNPKELLAGSYV